MPATPYHPNQADHLNPKHCIAPEVDRPKLASFGKVTKAAVPLSANPSSHPPVLQPPIQPRHNWLCLVNRSRTPGHLVRSLPCNKIHHQFNKSIAPELLPRIGLEWLALKTKGRLFRLSISARRTTPIGFVWSAAFPPVSRAHRAMPTRLACTLSLSTAPQVKSTHADKTRT